MIRFVLSSGDSKNSFVVSGSEDSTLKIWRLAEVGTDKSGKFALQAEHTEVAHQKGINSVSVSPDDKWLVSAGGDKVAKVGPHWPVLDAFSGLMSFFLLLTVF